MPHVLCRNHGVQRPMDAIESKMPVVISSGEVFGAMVGKDVGIDVGGTAVEDGMSSLSMLVPLVQGISISYCISISIV
jgi:hypothetical protein